MRTARGRMATPSAYLHWPQTPRTCGDAGPVSRGRGVMRNRFFWIRGRCACTGKIPMPAAWCTTPTICGFLGRRTEWLRSLGIEQMALRNNTA
jgi:hypothetical protein